MSGFRKFTVVEKVRESAVITSFLLEPSKEGDWLPFKAGQFLTVNIPVPMGEAGRTLRRTYTVSSPPSLQGRYRITVKRESAPGTEHASALLHDTVNPGDVLEIAGPSGDFTLDACSTRAVLLLSGGVGLTPMISMLHELAHQSDRPVYFLHACENGEVQALGDEVRALQAVRPGIHSHICYRTPTDEDHAAVRFQTAGTITREVLQGFLPLDDYDVYMCGPEPFMQAMFGLLTGLGVREERIAYEFFTNGKKLGAQTAAPVRKVEAPVPSADVSSGLAIRLSKSEKDLIWDPSASSLLSFLEDQGLSPEFSCRAGICGSCKCRVTEGKVEYFEEPLDELDENDVLLCCSRPLQPMVLDL
ncbi:2Fe-2S iron-sulfur cluster-binding protein [Rhizobium sp. NRK18]|uniref:2Fe-2S iron-sulfur cluster-binding protein n=1 Tax=Rhizobium sp. NRK18 TaxID=2964667 RepID=UPI0021C2A1B5|nr:2Fe-2S iron-sulfur cluster-binding protein [Rhizobium sp. NRK18]MCQ2005986.1 2Fe-2S iron-sulfur cluster-binding protein [Rhizobium sp. NRK18]